ncbi:hypothetical protein [Ekhidna sp. To15]|uniref:hypothetical protein n=1 Tax=Ekhidna sp. To15 TaxID=3395267 RepID=UPI003F5290E7
MRLIITSVLSLTILLGCNRNTSQNSTQTSATTNSLSSAKDYKPNPDEVVISAKLISYQDGIASVEVIKQIATGFGAKAVLNSGDKLSLSCQTRPNDNFICAFEFGDSMDDQKVYRITRFLK